MKRLSILFSLLIGLAMNQPVLAFKNADRQKLLKTNSCPRCDLRYANLTGENLTKAYLAGANLTGANLSRVNLNQANLTRANLTGADLTGADLSWANGPGINLSNADLTNAKNLHTTSFFGATFCETTIPDGSVRNSGCTVATTSSTASSSSQVTYLDVPEEITAYCYDSNYNYFWEGDEGCGPDKHITKQQFDNKRLYSTATSSSSSTSTTSSSSSTSRIKIGSRTLDSTRIHVINIADASSNPEAIHDFQVNLNYSNVSTYLRPTKTTYQRGLGSSKAKNADYLVILHVASTVLDREITDQKTVESEYKYTTRRIPNDDYEKARYSVQKVCDNYERWNALFFSCGTHGSPRDQMNCVNNLGPVVKQLREECDREKYKLSNIPLTIEEPVYSPYSFRKSMINIQKNVLINIYIVDKKNDSIVMAPVSVSGQKKTYLLVHGLSDKDPEYSKHMRNTSSDDKISGYEKLPLDIRLSTVFDSFSVNKEDAQTLPDLSAVEKHILGLTTTPAEEEEETHIATKTAEDARFTPVVVVLHPGGGIGSGFFVAHDTVLTNYHVIEGTSYIELAMFNGEETFGKVIAKDIRLDLALVKVQARGTPVVFYRENSLTLGGTVEAIGHPSGLEFSIARGVISGIRRLPSSYDPGGKAIRFIQTDVAINPGNSGGPLYLDDKVIGVNTQKLVSEEIEGLSFAVHYSEVIRFLEKNGIK